MATPIPKHAGGAVSRPPTRPYRDFLTPLLHRRFTSATLITLGICYVEAVWMGPWNSFLWTWVPFSWTGSRTLMLFLCALFVYVLHISQLHIGQRTTKSPAETFFKSILRTDAVFTVVTYCLSAFLFCETYIFFSDEDWKLGWIDPGRPHERPKLNERRFYLPTMFILLGIYQAIKHLVEDYSRVEVPIRKDNVGTKQRKLHRVLEQIKPQIVPILARSLVSLIAGTLVYVIFLREKVWWWAYFWGKNFFALPRYSYPGGLINMGDVYFRFLFEASVLLFLWESTTIIYRVFMANEPLKKAVPVTDNSKDPNGNLILGLKSKKDILRGFAFWELLVISQRFEARRRKIFEEIQPRAEFGGTTSWKQILNLCLDEINSVSVRIQEFKKPSASGPAASSPAIIHPIDNKPKIASPVVKTDDIWVASPPPAKRLDRYAHKAEEFVRSRSGAHPLEEPPIQKLLTYGSEHLLTEEQRAHLKPAYLQHSFGEWAVNHVLQLPYVGPFFRQTFARRATCVVLGTPYSRATSVADAVESLKNLAKASLKEDVMGQVQKDVPSIIRAFTNTILEVEAFVGALQPHWTDVEWDGKREVPEVEALLAVLRQALEELLIAFGEYLEGGLGMGRREVREYKEVAERGKARRHSGSVDVEMKEAR